MSRTLERRLRRLEQEADITDDDYEVIESEFSDETKDLMREAMRTLGRLSPEEIETQINRKWHTRRPRVAQLSAVEREQRLLAIRRRGKDHPAAGAFIDQALQSERMNIVPELSPETIAALDEARATLMRQAPAA
jgi:hypothetical protein